MPKTKLSIPTEPSSAVAVLEPVPTPDLQLTPVIPPGTLAAPQYLHDADVEGEVSSEDTRTPRLNIVAKTGALSDIFTPGSIVLNKETVLVGPGAPLEMVALHIKKRYQEDLVFGEEMGQIVNTAAEVVQRGGSTQYGDANFWTPIADILFFVKKPDTGKADLEPHFFYEVNGEFYTLALFTARKSSYTSIAKAIFTVKQFQGSVRSVNFEMTTAIRTWAGNSWWSPSLRPSGKPSPEVADYLTKLPL